MLDVISPQQILTAQTTGAFSPTGLLKSVAKREHFGRKTIAMFFSGEKKSYLSTTMFQPLPLLEDFLSTAASLTVEYFT